MKVLLADDDRELVDLLRYAFKRDGHTPVTAFDGEAALRMLEMEGPDIVLLDLNMPKRHGLDVLKEIRRHSQVPVLVLTGVGDEDHIVNAFKMGADDYVVKPFRPRELTVRVDALLRRTLNSAPRSHNGSPVLTCGEIAVDPRRREVTFGMRPIRLTRNEFGLLHYLMLNKGIVISASDLLMNVWGYDAEESEDIVKVTISRLRHKVELEPSEPRYIKTVHGVGYVMQEDK